VPSSALPPSLTIPDRPAHNGLQVAAPSHPGPLAAPHEVRIDGRVEKGESERNSRKKVLNSVNHSLETLPPFFYSCSASAPICIVCISIFNLYLLYIDGASIYLSYNIIR